jgi:hypothetical protein
MSTALDTASATPLESVSAVMFQNWERVTFLHWRIRREEIQARLPRGLTVDTFDGEAWLGLTPFELTGLRPPFLPALPWISRFLETNLRTYVRGPDGAPGIWFFSLDASRLAAVIGARIGYGLPYHWARMRVRMREKEMGYFSRRYFGRGAAQVVIRHGDPIIAAEREIFLTARFRLYATIAGRLAHADVEHRPWPLENAHVIRIEQNLTDAHDLRINGEPLVHFSPGVETRIGRPRWSSVPRHTLTS